MEETLDAAIDRLFGKPGSAGPAPPRADAGVAGVADASAAARLQPVERPGAAGEADRKALAAEALAHYERALAAQRDGNWALYGEEIKKLGEELKKLP